MLNNVKYLNSGLISGYVVLLTNRLIIYGNQNIGSQDIDNLFLGWKNELSELKCYGIDYIDDAILECLDLIPSEIGVMVYTVIDQPRFDKLLKLINSIEQVLADSEYPIKLIIETNE